MRRTLAAGLTLLTVTALATPTAAAPEANRHGAPKQASLTNFASLPAETYVPGSEPSGSALGTTPVNGVTPPFADQPVQGFSGVLRNSDGTYDVLSDNGYGTKANSADFNLRIHRIAPDFRSGNVDVLGGITLTDPNGHIKTPLTRADRVLTGADLDVESFTRGSDGSYWMGDEFGPYLLHFDRAGRLLAAPVPLPGVRAPENPAGNPNIGGSKGFEGITLSPDGKTINALLEGTVAGDTPGTLRLNEFDIASNSFTGKKWVYQLENPNFAIGDAIAVDGNRLLIIERDGAQGVDALVKRVYLADKRDRDKDGKLDKTLVADLLNLANPKHVGGQADPFRFPFVTIEDVTILDDRTIAVLNDNNFPSSSGRTPGKPDNNEFITIRLAENLHADPRVLRRR
ncbi:esterase-like activity of phytase family protein [Lentzea sp. BCCO 10_0856]|uniref:Esterase-like activity of phytase family protein n=1 Tax=Lentzea miocenica TaxID=3095431 RepID=A0ABU4T8M6_9PSEU|nr:esterase-like activity of phytase family protein [Lentzea sp. BCCO 10_0856]MDX8034519.1 esterase-like activity of phytase family protein [Lentzea sp. BCCO 10_0856]